MSSLLLHLTERPKGGSGKSQYGSRWIPIASPIVALLLISVSVHAQFPSGSGVTVAPSRSPVDIPQTNLTPIAPRSSGGSAYGSSIGTIAPSLATPSPGMPGSTASGSLFDPYATGQTPGYYQPAMPPVSAAPIGPAPITGLPPSPGIGGGSFFGGPPSYPASAPMSSALNGPSLNGPYATPPPIVSPQPVPNVYGAPGGFGTPTYPSTIYPSGSPSTLFPSGIIGSPAFSGDANSVFSVYRFFQGPRFRYTYVGGGNGAKDLSTNDFDASVAFAFPNFLYSSQPLFVVPSFSLSLWDGPDGSTGADLPANAYGGFLDFGWQTDPNQMFGAEVGVRVGAFTDFDTFNSDSIRIIGKGLGSFRITPSSTLKLGVYYLDRVDWKLLPAGGILWQPTPHRRWDIFFPQPKVSCYCRTIGTQDVWWYLAGDYGGGSWTIKRDSGASDRIDINDLRVMVGTEWGRSDLIRFGRRTAFMELGYVFDREIVYESDRSDNISPGSAFMFRAGIGY